MAVGSTSGLALSVSNLGQVVRTRTFGQQAVEFGTGQGAVTVRPNYLRLER